MFNSIKFAIVLSLISSISLHAEVQNVSAIDEYGDLYVNEGTFKNKSQKIPWSSWWFPHYENFLFSNDSRISPLKKYDQYVEAVTGLNPDASKYEEENFYLPRAVSWSGLCDAWAVASVYSAEPKTEKTIEGITFEIGDQKALLLKSFEKIKGLKYFGQRNDGQWDSDYSDIRPHEFHKLLQRELLENGRNFIIDHDAGIEVWNVPVYQAETQIVRDRHDKRVFHVKTIIATASPHVPDVNFVGTRHVIRTYTYDLYAYQENGHGSHIVGGAWTEDSRWDHPDYVVVLPKQGVQHESQNIMIENQYVNAIISNDRETLALY